MCESDAVIEQARAAGILEDLVKRSSLFVELFKDTLSIFQDPPASFLTSTTSSVGIGTDYETITKITDENEREQNDDKKQHEEREAACTPIDNIQDDDVFVEENVTPFYMNSGIFQN